MSDGIWSALSGAVGQITALDVAANNAANATTPGYRADHVVFQEHLNRAGQGRSPARPGLHYTSVGTVVPSQRSGPILQTSRPLDAAIRGDGYFAVSTTQGERYTRVGSFDVATDGTLVTRSGEAAVGINGKKIRVPRDGSDVRLASDGSVLVAGQSVGQLKVVRLDPKTSLEKEGAILFRVAAGAPPAAIAPSLETGALEQSNRSGIEGMMDIVNASRGFDACERVIDAFRDADRRAAMAIAGRSG